MGVVRVDCCWGSIRHHVVLLIVEPREGVLSCVLCFRCSRYPLVGCHSSMVYTCVDQEYEGKFNFELAVAGEAQSSDLVVLPAPTDEGDDHACAGLEPSLTSVNGTIRGTSAASIRAYLFPHNFQIMTHHYPSLSTPGQETETYFKQWYCLHLALQSEIPKKWHFTHVCMYTRSILLARLDWMFDGQVLLPP